MDYTKRQYEEEILGKIKALNNRAAAINKRVARFNNRQVDIITPFGAIEVKTVKNINSRKSIDDVLQRAQALNARISANANTPIYEASLKTVRTLAVSADSEEPEEFEILFTRKSKFL